MKIAFVSNYLNHHQIPFCRKMESLLGEGNFKFIAMQPMAKERKNMGWSLAEKYDFEIKAWESEETKKEAKEIADNFDAVIYGGGSFTSFVRKRIEEGRLTFLNSEHIYKNCLWKVFSPRGCYYVQKNHGRYRNKNVYLLCSSAYVASDYAKQLAYIGKAFKWAYFPKTETYNIDELINKKGEKINILWVARYLDLKHPEYPVLLAEKLKKAGCRFKIKMIGSGELFEQTKSLIESKGLTDCVEQIGNMKPEEVREYMENSHIYLFTSDNGEGWGAVLNEAMNSACVPVACVEAGATPYLVKHGQNGYIYKKGDFNAFYKYVKYLIDNRKQMDKMGIAAYETIKNMWNAELAAQRLVKLCEGLLSSNAVEFEEGPLSKEKNITRRAVRKVF